MFANSIVEPLLGSVLCLLFGRVVFSWRVV